MEIELKLQSILHLQIIILIIRNMNLDLPPQETKFLKWIVHFFVLTSTRMYNFNCIDCG